MEGSIELNCHSCEISFDSHSDLKEHMNFEHGELTSFKKKKKNCRNEQTIVLKREVVDIDTSDVHMWEADVISGKSNHESNINDDVEKYRGNKQIKAEKIILDWKCVICSTEKEEKSFETDNDLLFHHMSHSILEIAQALTDVQSLLKSSDLFEDLFKLAIREQALYKKIQAEEKEIEENDYLEVDEIPDEDYNTFDDLDVVHPNDVQFNDNFHENDFTEKNNLEDNHDTNWEVSIRQADHEKTSTAKNYNAVYENNPHTPGEFAFEVVKENQHQCNICTKVFHYSFELREHMHSHNANPALLLKIPTKPSKVRQELITNTNSTPEFFDNNHDIDGTYKPLKCDSCDKTFKTSKNLKEHTYKMHTAKLMECDFCDKTFKRTSHLKLHLTKIHKNSSDHTCQICNRSFGVRQSLDKHMSYVHGIQDEYTCKICQMKFQQKEVGEFKTHLINVHQLEIYCCHLCHKFFKAEENMKRHISNIHEGKKDFQCNLCENRKFPGKIDLKMHMLRIHKVQEEQSCDICDQKFGKIEDLRNHLTNDHNLTIFKCPKKNCDKFYRAKGILKNHIETVHEKSKQAVCKVCGKSLVSGFRLKQHMLQIHGFEGEDLSLHEEPKIFQCDFCDIKPFTKAGNYKNHLKNVHQQLITTSELLY